MSFRKILRFAALIYLARARNIRSPHGRRDKQGNWHPFANSEHAPCCEKISPQNRNLLHQHCQSLEHIAFFYNVDESHLMEEYMKIKNLSKKEIINRLRKYKLVMRQVPF